MMPSKYYFTSLEKTSFVVDCSTLCISSFEIAEYSSTTTYKSGDII
jgi:hypothetical protein